jgi:hypothetical protein
MGLALIYVAVWAVSFAVMFASTRSLRAAQVRYQIVPWVPQVARIMSVVGVVLASLSALLLWHLTGTIAWVAFLAGVSLVGWSLGRVYRRIQEVPKHPLGL